MQLWVVFAVAMQFWVAVIMAEAVVVVADRGQCWLWLDVAFFLFIF